MPTTDSFQAGGLSLHAEQRSDGQWYIASYVSADIARVSGDGSEMRLTAGPFEQTTINAVAAWWRQLERLPQGLVQIASGAEVADDGFAASTR